MQERASRISKISPKVLVLESIPTSDKYLVPKKQVYEENGNNSQYLTISGSDRYLVSSTVILGFLQIMSIFRYDAS